MNIQDSPTKVIDPKQRKAVERAVRKERSKIVSLELDGVHLDSSVRSMQELSEKLWLLPALKAHDHEGLCIDLHKVYIIGRHTSVRDKFAFMCFSNVWNLLNMYRAIASGYSVTLQTDVTSKASTSAFNKQGFGVNMLGGHIAVWSFSLIPAETESGDTYAQSYAATKSAARAVMRLKLCGNPDCATCSCIAFIKSNETVAACMRSRPYKELKQNPIDYLVADAFAGLFPFAKESLGLDYKNTCFTHVSAIPKNNGTAAGYFLDRESYDRYYEYLLRISKCAYEEVGFCIQALLVDHLKSVGEERAAEWFEQYWTGPEKGRWMLANGGIGCIGNNQGMESTWRWDRMAISGGRQVRARARVCMAKS